MSDTLNNPHDKLFQETWLRPEVVEDFIEYYMPTAVAQHLDKKTLKIEKDSFIDQDLKEHYSDILYSLTLKNGTPCQLYLLFDHKSYPDKWVRFQLLRYMVRNWELQEKAGKLKKKDGLPLIIPIVFYHGQKVWGYDFEFIDLFCGDVPDAIKPYVPNFQHMMCDLSQISDEAIKGRIIIQAAMQVFKHIFDPDFDQKLPDILALFNNLSKQSTGLEYLHTLLLYLNNTVDIDKDEFKTIVQKALPNLGEDIMATPAEQWRNEGRLEGRLEGIQQGEMKAKKEVLVKLLTLKFGELNEAIIKKIDNAKVEQLTQWSERILFAKTIDEIFR